jgi:hypothetical protein
MAKVSSVHGGGRILPRSNTHLTEPQQAGCLFHSNSKTFLKLIELGELLKKYHNYCKFFPVT